MKKSLKVLSSVVESKSFNAKLKGLIEKKKVKNIDYALTTMKNENVKPDIYTVTILWRNFVKNESTKSKIEDMMSTNNIEPNQYYYSCVLKYHIDRHEWSECQRVINQMENVRVEYDRPLLTTLLKFYYATNNHAKFQDIMDSLSKEPFDIAIWNTLLELYSGDSTQFNEILGKMGNERNLTTYDLLLKHYTSIRDYKMVEATLFQLKRSKLFKHYV